MAANYDVLLIKAATIGDIKQVQALLAAGADVDASTASRTTVLMLATIGGYSEIVRLLIEHGAELNAPIGEPFLNIAAAQGDRDTVQTLLDFGADPNQQAPDGKTALIKAAERNQIDAMQLLLAKTDVNLQDAAQATALMWAASWGDFQAVQLLVQAGANIDTKNRGGYTALALAEFNGYEDIAQMLQHLGAKEQ